MYFLFKIWELKDWRICKMSPELDKKLCEKYPHIFRDRNKSMKETAMCWGFDCKDGWYDLIDILCKNIMSYCLSSPGLPGIPIALQVKEKFGTLRFYTLGGDDHIQDLISAAEILSERTCEQCGNPGKLYTRGWMYVACDEHLKDEDK